MKRDCDWNKHGRKCEAVSREEGKFPPLFHRENWGRVTDSTPLRRAFHSVYLSSSDADDDIDIEERLKPLNPSGFQDIETV